MPGTDTFVMATIRARVLRTRKDLFYSYAENPY
jgi:hypothetical protein